MAEGTGDEGQRACVVGVMNLDRFSSIPFVKGGYDYDDAHCYGLVWLHYRDRLGILLPRYDGRDIFDAEGNAPLFERDRQDWIRVDEPRDHDVAVMRAITDPALDFHLGVVVEKRKVMHTQRLKGVQVERLSAPHIRSRIVEFRRHPQLA